MAVQTKDIKENGKWLGSYTRDKVHYITKAKTLHIAIAARCDPRNWETLFPTYKGCTMSDEFKDFQQFAEWYAQQVGYGVAGYQIDKDFLSGESLQYNRNTCVLIPRNLNVFLTFNKKGNMYPGVTSSGNRYRASLSIDGVSVQLGAFDTKEEAYNAYCQAKEAHARKWADRLDGTGQVDSKVIAALRTWKVDSKGQLSLIF